MPLLGSALNSWTQAKYNLKKSTYQRFLLVTLWRSEEKTSPSIVQYCHNIEKRQFLLKQLHPNARKISELAATAYAQTEKLKCFHSSGVTICIQCYTYWCFYEAYLSWFKRSHNEIFFPSPDIFIVLSLSRLLKQTRS